MKEEEKNETSKTHQCFLNEKTSAKLTPKAVD